MVTCLKHGWVIGGSFAYICINHLYLPPDCDLQNPQMDEPGTFSGRNLFGGLQVCTQPHWSKGSFCRYGSFALTWRGILKSPYGITTKRHNQSQYDIIRKTKKKGKCFTITLHYFIRIGIILFSFFWGGSIRWRLLMYQPWIWGFAFASAQLDRNSTGCLDGEFELLLDFLWFYIIYNWLIRSAY